MNRGSVAGVRMMQRKTGGRSMLDKNGILYPLLVIAAISVAVASLIAVILMTGVLQSSVSALSPAARFFGIEFS